MPRLKQKINLAVNKTIETFKKGGLVIFPTDTVWGIGASLKNLSALNKLYFIKKRESKKPTAVLVANLLQARKYGSFDSQAETLAKQNWPGALTIIVKAKNSVPLLIQSSKKTIGIRVPNHPLILKIIRKLNTGIVTTSANFSGQMAPRSKKEIDKKLIDLSDFFLDTPDNKNLSLPSTVVDVTENPPQILRQGKILIRGATS